jgi:hypothetical protein
MMLTLMHDANELMMWTIMDDANEQAKPSLQKSPPEM